MEQIISPIARTFNGTRFQSTSEALWAMLFHWADIKATYQPIFVVDPTKDNPGWFVDLGIELNGKLIYVEVKHVGILGLDGFEPLERYEMALMSPYHADEVWLVLSRPEFKSDGSTRWGWKLSLDKGIEDLDLGFISSDLCSWTFAISCWMQSWRELVDMKENQRDEDQLPFAY